MTKISQDIVEGSAPIMTTGTTAFTEDATMVSSMARDSITIQDLGPPRYDSNTIADFLAKPAIVGGGTITPANVANTTIWSSSIESLLFTPTLFIEKIRGYNLIKATANIKVLLNAQPFHQGRLLLHLLPCVAGVTAGSAGSYIRMHNTNLCQKTQHPNVEIDFRVGSAEMAIPYLTPTTHYDLFNSRYDWGTVYLDVLASMRAGASASQSVEYTIYAYFTDVELSAPIYSTIGSGGFAPESGAAPNRGRVKNRRVKVKSSLESEEKSEKWASSSLMSLSKVTGALSAVPGASTMSSVLSAGAGVLSNFGWSKPILQNSPTYVIENPQRYQGNSKGDNTSDVLMMSSNAKMEPLEGFGGTDVDEMSFAYLKSIPAYVSTFSITTDMPAGVSVYNKPIHPRFLCQTRAVTAGTYSGNQNDYPPAFYLARLFQYYRGSIKVKFKFVKTDFHSLRLSVTYTTTNSTPTNLAAEAYSLREVIDIRTSDEFEMTLPYLKGTNYLCSAEPQGDGTDLHGTLSVRVLNSLVAPETVAQELDVLVYFSAGDDFELAQLSSKQVITFAPEAFEIGNGNSSDPSLMHNVASIGDPFLSVKQIIQCASPYQVSSALGVTGKNFWFDPFALGMRRFQTTYSEPDVVGDFVSLIMPGYVFMRGSMRLMGYRQAAITTTSAAVRVVQFPRLVSYTAAVGADNNAAANTQFAIPAVTQSFATTRGILANRVSTAGVFDVICPHACRTTHKLVRPRVFGESYYTAYWDQSPTVPFVLSNIDVNTLCLMRAAADDFTLGYFIGFPSIMDQLVVAPQLYIQ